MSKPEDNESLGKGNEFQQDRRPRDVGPYADKPRNTGYDRPRDAGYDRPRDAGYDRPPRDAGQDRPPRDAGYDNRPQRDSGYDRPQSNQRDQRDQREQRGFNRQNDMHQSMGDPRVKQDSYGYSQERSRGNQFEDDQPRMIRHSNEVVNNIPQQSFLHNPLANSRQGNRMTGMQPGHIQDTRSLNQMNSNLDIHQPQSHIQESYILNDVMPNPSMNDLMHNNPDGGISHLDQYVLPPISSSVDAPGMGSNAAYMSNAGGMQSIPMSNIIPSNSNPGGRVSAQYNPMPTNSSSMSPGWTGVNTTGMYNQSTPSYLDALVDMCEQFHNILPIPKNATNTVYVEGIPIDAREREVARKYSIS
jgi:hypothetical protein